MKRIETAKFSVPKDYKSLDSEPLVLHAKPRSSAETLIILVHGLTGHRYEYWGNLPQFLLEDIPGIDLGLYQYRTALRRFGWFKSIDIESEGRVLSGHLCRLRRYKSIAIISHSMGGLLIKSAICSMIDGNLDHHLKKLSCLVLLASPQLGSTRVPALAKLFSRDGRALYPHGPLMQRMDKVFGARLNLDKTVDPTGKFTIPTWAIVGAEDFWVDALSAGIGIPESQRHFIRGTHGSLKEPKLKSEDSYQLIRESIDATLKPTGVASATLEEIQEEAAAVTHVTKIREIAVKHFGNEVTPESVLLDFANRGGVLWIVKHTIVLPDEERQRIVGYLCLIPLDDSAYRDVLAGSLRGLDISVEHTPPIGENPAAIYIGAIAANDHYSKAVVIRALKAQIELAKRDNVTHFLTRPVTDDGLRLCHRHGFSPVNGAREKGALYMYDSDSQRGRASRTAA